MIKKTLISFLLLTALYIMGVRLMMPFPKAAQHQWQDNAIKAQDYLYQKGAGSRNVLVGSSLSCRILTDSLVNFTNLALNGQSIFDGLAIIDHKKELPVNVFIELNMVMRGENKIFTGSLFQPMLFVMRDKLPALRDGYQPLGLAGKPVSACVQTLLSALKSRLIRKKPEAVPPAIAATGQEPAAQTSTVQAPVKVNLSDGLFLRLLKIQEDNYSKAADSASLYRNLNELARYVDGLRSKNVNVYFFEMPIDAHLSDLPLARSIRDGFHRIFPPGKYVYIPQPDCTGYETSDGLHLRDPDAIRYTSYLKSRTASL